MSSAPQPQLQRRNETYTRLGVIGDIHTRADRLEWALRVLKQQEVECILVTGDVVDGPQPHAVDRVCELLQKFQVGCVLGNHDRWLLDKQHRDLTEATFPEDVGRATREFLQSLPHSVELQTVQGRLLLGHGLGSNDMTCLYPYDHGPSLQYNTTLQAILRAEQYRYVISGHTHMRMVREISGVTFINAGALHYTREPCCLLLDFQQRQAQFFEYADDTLLHRGPQHSL
ncbi:MAG TPA: metallophosphoesterase family protein [Polyangiales bacterium]|nr:metallophosphoesterase family protein [Polyangiales bacterium]